ncbi:hypothetical protein QR680_012057 [Steinernema hermaphroditum]|uniref:Uncharacterized protein n=1 Tax=Steinernema hermaphroditum TaxID=289476 RepID=A0AA39I0T1_9BILA|nr:hypothetical protein QR680_012057 [Steinernema hermaphroditum]
MDLVTRECNDRLIDLFKGVRVTSVDFFCLILQLIQQTTTIVLGRIPHDLRHFSAFHCPSSRYFRQQFQFLECIKVTFFRHSLETISQDPRKRHFKLARGSNNQPARQLSLTLLQLTLCKALQLPQTVAECLCLSECISTARVILRGQDAENQF